MNFEHKIIIGDSRHMSDITDKSVNLIITSPPYWQLKDYGKRNQIGFNDSYEKYINNLNLVWNECYRVLESGCKMCVNIGDQFARSVYYGRYKIIPIRTEIIKFCEHIGFDYLGAIIWQKVTTCNTTGGATIMGSYPYPRNGILKIDYEFILLFKKPGKSKPVSKEIKSKSQLSKEEWNKYFQGHWNFSGEKQDRHLAMFPVELPTRLIKMFSFYNDIILDPFVGSGTTSLAAKQLGRRSYGYEINESNLPIILDKIDLLPSNNHIEIIKQELDSQIDFDEKISKLPYIFKDPVKFDKKVDPRKEQYGSKISLKDDRNNRKEYYSVKKIIKPNLIELNTGMKVRLIGVVNKPNTATSAVNFLDKKTKGQKIYLAFDKKLKNRSDELLAYVYLKNKTFVNRHLIRTGLVSIDKEQDYRYKDHFLKSQM